MCSIDFSSPHLHLVCLNQRSIISVTWQAIWYSKNKLLTAGCRKEGWNKKEQQKQNIPVLVRWWEHSLFPKCFFKREAISSVRMVWNTISLFWKQKSKQTPICCRERNPQFGCSPYDVWWQLWKNWCLWSQSVEVLQTCLCGWSDGRSKQYLPLLLTASIE